MTPYRPVDFIVSTLYMTREEANSVNYKTSNDVYLLILKNGFL